MYLYEVGTIGRGACGPAKFQLACGFAYRSRDTFAEQGLQEQCNNDEYQLLPATEFLYYAF
jgi:hypothetical protein